ncbi:hypothetical protein HPC49_01915 [Pyxidicoccus fallax]|uniref:Uncharacterized protein n=1 Tax=Pyxidicoccus fallax TaxID=394095 RepID=A0A848LAC5_9BACT|nr:hypothetical protein [Pyxidicoccus fallax]NMO13805.1 hypothetical protein [Pyxidicoccus fallax]NPC77008.1 hypothetical protein [Pyxidicoccus fallax]
MDTLLRRPVLVSLFLFVLGAPFRGGQWPSWLLVLTLAVLALDELKPAVYVARAPRWLARPWLGIIGGAVLVLYAIAFGEWTFGQVLWLAGAGVFLHDAWKRGEPRHLRAALKRAAEASETPEALPVGAEGSKKRVLISMGLFALSFLLSGYGEVPGAPRLGLVWVAVTGLLLAQTLKPEWAARLPVWLRRPTLGAAAAIVFLLVNVSISSFTPAFFLWTAATVVFLRDAALRGELGPFEPRLLWRGWGRRVAVVGTFIAAMSLSGQWDNNYYSPGYTRTSESSSTYYNSQGDLMRRTVTTTERVPSSSFGGDTTAWTYGDGLPALGLLALLALLAWKGPGHPVLARTAPLAVIAPMGLWALTHLIENHNIAKGFEGSPGYVGEGGGPFGFLLGLAIATVGVVLQGRRTLPVPPPIEAAVPVPPPAG